MLRSASTVSNGLLYFLIMEERLRQAELERRGLVLPARELGFSAAVRGSQQVADFTCQSKHSEVEVGLARGSCYAWNGTGSSSVYFEIP